MKSKLFWIVFGLILTIGLVTRIVPLKNNNFFFTMDQGNDAVHVREILVRHKILLVGPETGIKGVYHGAGWYYFIAIGYWLFRGHPFGAIFMLIILNLGLTALLMLEIGRRVSPKLGLFIGASLQIFWWFYIASLYGFNPFPTVALSFFTILGLIEFLNYKRKREYLLAAIPVGLAYHCEIAFAIPLTIFFVVVGIWALLHKFIFLRLFVVAMFILSVFWIPRVFFEARTSFSQTRALRNEIGNPEGIFSRTNFIYMAERYEDMIGKTTLPLSPRLGFFFYVAILGIFILRKQSNKNPWRKRFVELMLALIVISWVTFGSNLGWQSWHTTAIPPLVFISLLLGVSTFSRKFSYPLLALILITQMSIFVERYKQNFYPSENASILKNELGAIDWVYKNSEGKGFYVYSYLPSVLDYPYQYLFWWYGRETYGYVPCEYSSFPGATALFVPGRKYYQEPIRECDKRFEFLVIEPDEHTFVRLGWLEEITKNSKLIEQSKVGNIEVQKRLVLTD